jgi:hypothetical protein
MKKHFKILRYFLLPTLTFILLRWAYFLDFNKALSIITRPDSGGWRVLLIIVEVSFYIGLYFYFKYKEEVTEKFCSGNKAKDTIINEIRTFLSTTNDTYYTKGKNTITIYVDPKH